MKRDKMWMGRIAAAMLGGCMLLGAAASSADQTDQRLDLLFATLQKTKQPGEVQVTQDMIWAIWLENDDDEIEILMQEGVRAMGQNRLRVALEMFDDMVLLAPDFAEAWNKRATVHYMLGNLLQSIVDVGKTLALEPRHFGALSGLGQIYLLLGDETGALSAFEQALSMHPHLSGARAAVDVLLPKVRGRAL